MQKQEQRTIYVRRAARKDQPAACPPGQDRTSYRRFAARMRRRRRRRRGLVLLAALVLALAAVLLLPHFGAPDLAAQALELAGGVLPAQASAGFVVAVDPGHGGVDTGAQGLGFQESEMTWRTANDLMALLEADSRFTPVLTKTEEETLKPSERAANAAAAGAGLLISIHGNADPVYGSTGFECYPVPPGRQYNAESLAFAGELTAGFAGAGSALRGENGIRYCYYDVNNEKQIVEAGAAADSSDPSFTVLEECGCPAVLAEQCFITNAADVKAFAGDAGCQAAAQLYYDAIVRWYTARGQTG